MDFTKENIEALIFDYHEGNLSDSEKVKVLDLIHRYPEYESDFMLMAQTYAHVDNELPDYGLTASLLQRPAVAWYNRTSVKVLLVLVCAIGGFALYFSVSDKAQQVMKPAIVEEKAAHHTSKLEKEVSVKTPERVLLPKEKQSAAGESKVAIKTAPDTIKVADIVAEEHIVENRTVAEKTEARVHKQADTVAKSGTIVLPEKEPEEVKKNKKRKGLNMKPAGNFIPVNSDF